MIPVSPAPLLEHRRIMRCLLALLALLLAVSSVPPAQAQGALPGSFAPARCPLPIPAGLTVDCGYLTVAESRRNPTGRTIELAVAIVRSPSPSVRTDPVIFLTGGPGQPALPLVPLAGQLFGAILAERDVIFIDQRGTGYSRPALNCAVTASPTQGPLLPRNVGLADRPVVVQFLTEALIACGRQLRAAGIELSAYNSVESAADLEDLRIALGYNTWNLYGGSYGTRLALTAMRYRPENIRSAVLDSVYPPQANFHTGVFASYNRALGLLAAACAADAACNRAYPDLIGTFEQLVERMNRNAIQLPIRNLETGELIDYLPFSGVDFSLVLFQLFYSTQAIPFLPALIGETARGNLELLSNLASTIFTSNLPGGVPVISQGMQVAVQCNEDVTFAEPEDFVGARDRNRRVAALAFSALFNEAVLEICAAWGITSTDPTENQAVRSSVPTLMIAGEFDPITPPENARDAADTLNNSTVVVYPRGGHTPSILNPCLTSIVTRFLNAPEAALNTACLVQEPPAPFVVLR